MSCPEAEQLKNRLKECTSAYLAADAQRTEGETAIAADFAIYALDEAKRKYWFHVNQHRCEVLDKTK